MQSINHDSELMTQYIAAEAFPNAERLIATRDENGRLLLFSLGTDKKFYVSKIADSGQRMLLDLGAMLHLPESYVGHALSVAQSPASSTLYIIVATAHGDALEQSQVHLLKPFDPAERDLGSRMTQLQDLIVTESSPKYSRVYSINTINGVVESDYPTTLLTYQTTIHRSQDLESVVVTGTDGAYTWERKQNVKLPENASEILAVQPLNLKLGDLTLPGYAALYVLQGKPQLVFRTVNTSAEYAQTFRCPLKARALSAVIRNDGFSDMLIGGQGLYQFDADLIDTSNQTEARLISNSDVFGSIHYLHVTQNDSELTVWATNSSNGIGYLKASTKDLSLVEEPVQVVPDDQGGRIAPFKATASDTEKFVFSDKHGQLSLLEQDKSGIWKVSPLMTPALDKIFSVQSYVSQISPLGKDNSLLPWTSILLRSSDDVSIIVNGRPLLATPDGIRVESDHDGLVTITIPTEDVSTHTFTVSNIPSSTEPQPKEHPFDPSDKVFDSISKIQKGDDLKNVTLSDGSKLIEDVPDEKLDAVAQALAASVNRRNRIKEGLKKTVVELDLEEQAYGWNAHIAAEASASGIEDMLWGAWRWLEKQASKISSFIIKGAEFLVTIAGKAYRWVLKTVTEVGKAVTFLLKQVIKSIKKVVQWIGWLFEWKDIQATKNSLVNIINDCFDKARQEVPNIKNSANGFFDKLQESVKQPPDDKVLNHPKNDATDSNANEDASESAVTRSVKTNWASYQFSHGGGANASVVGDFGEESDILSTLMTKDWEDEAKAIHKRFEAPVQENGSSITKGHNSRHGTKTKEIIEKSPPTFLSSIITAFQKLTTMGLDALDAVLNGLQKIFNKPIIIPVFSGIYKTFISGGKDLTILDAISLLVAMPATIIWKIFVNMTPPTFHPGDFAKLLSGSKFSSPLNGLPAKVKTQGISAELLYFNHLANCVSIATGLFGVAFDFVPSLTNMTSSVGLKNGLPIVVVAPDQPLVELASLKTSAKKEYWKRMKFWKQSFGWIYAAFSVPLHDPVEVSNLRTVAWIISVVEKFWKSVITMMSSIDEYFADIMQSVFDSIFAAVIYGLEIKIATLQFNSNKSPFDEDNLSSISQCIAMVFAMVRVFSTSVEKLVPDPTTKTIAKFVRIGSNAGSKLIKATKSVKKMNQKAYNPLPAEVGF